MQGTIFWEQKKKNFLKVINNFFHSFFNSANGKDIVNA